MNNKEVFKQNKEKIENAYDDFIKFYDGMGEFFQQREIPKGELETISSIKEIVSVLDGGNPNKKKPDNNPGAGYMTWTGPELTRADGRLAMQLVTLGEYASEAVLKANVMGRWIKWRKHNEWSPIKSKLEKDLMDKTEDKKKQPRVFKEDVEAEVSKEIFSESVIEGMMAGHADKLTTLFDATKSLLTALAHRINIKREERSYERK